MCAILAPVVRLLAALAALGALCLTALAGQAMPGGDTPGRGLRLADEGSVLVEPGDSLWSIALSIAGEQDPRDVVDAIQELNGLVGADLSAGQELLLP